MISPPAIHSIKDVDVPLVLCCSKAADQVGVINATQHGHLGPQPSQLLLLVGLRVADVAHLPGEDGIHRLVANFFVLCNLYFFCDRNLKSLSQVFK